MGYIIVRCTVTTMSIITVNLFDLDRGFNDNLSFLSQKKKDMFEAYPFF